MPFETFPVEGPHDAAGSAGNRTSEQVANDISRIYNTVAERGGKIIGSHALTALTDTGIRRPAMSSEVLFLVADMPDQQPA